jgi:hypothetical protein
MGWCSGSDIASAMIRAGKKYIPARHRKAFYNDVINALEDHDWDCQGDVMGEDELFDEVLKERNPDWYE